LAIMRLIDAYNRGYITEAQYLAYLDAGYTNESSIYVNITAYTDKTYTADIRLVKRDPNLRNEFQFDIWGTGSSSVLQANDAAYVRCNVDGRICGYSVFLDTSATATFDVWVKSTYPPSNSNSVTASAAPGTSSATYTVGTESAVSTWTQHINSGDYITFVCESNNNAHRAQCILVIEPATQLNALV
jgi:hypothetical protein